LGQFLGRESSLVVAGATLAVAAVFQPARRRIQQAVDRRFNRRGHDAAQTITAFSARLRQQIELGALTGELLAVVEETMQPTRASLWLRQPDEPPNLMRRVGTTDQHKTQRQYALGASGLCDQDRIGRRGRQGQCRR
jgi:hypothetical protein